MTQHNRCAMMDLGGRLRGGLAVLAMLATASTTFAIQPSRPGQTTGTRSGSSARPATQPKTTAPAAASVTTAETGEAAEADVPESIETTADRLNYDRDRGVVEGVGHVVIRKGDVELRADYVRVNTRTEIAEAFGDVVLTRGETVWRGPSLTYDFGAGEGLTGKFEAASPPFYVKAERSERKADGSFILYDCWMSTCEPGVDNIDFHVTAKKAEFKPDEYFKAKNAVWWFGRVPSMYLPYWHRNLQDDFGWSFRPGHSSRWGTFLLSSYRYRLNPGLKGRTHFDYRTERGLALGQDFSWNFGMDGTVGKVKGYVLNDDKPIDDDEDAESADIDEQRHRILLENSHRFTPRDRLRLRAHYLSDTDVLEDFFDREYRNERQPDNYAKYTHRGAHYTAGILARGRINDFYDSVQRLPEFQLDIFRQELGSSGIYYESETAATALERVFAEGSSDEDYDIFRFDTDHTFYRPDKHFGYLNVIPRIGFRGTHFSKTVEAFTTLTTTTTTFTNTIIDTTGTNTIITVSSDTNSTTSQVEGSADFRSLFELGFETSFKAFRVFNAGGQERRHIVEPYANYTLIPEPNVLPENLYQFDRVDRLDETHTVKLGVRQKYQAKRGNLPIDLVDLDLFTTVNLSPDDDEDSLESLNWDFELRPTRSWAIDGDGRFAIDESEIDRFNLELAYDAGQDVKAAAEYRYRVERSSLLATSLTFFPEDKWSFNLYGRYEFEESRFEEQGGYLQRRFDCLSLRTGLNFLPGYTRTDGSERDDEIKVLVELWLNAFPEATLGGRSSG